MLIGWNAPASLITTKKTEAMPGTTTVGIFIVQIDRPKKKGLKTHTSRLRSYLEHISFVRLCACCTRGDDDLVFVLTTILLLPNE
mmetsp:Transcript_11241/g.26684  ORF Transcript_11241/g.26684 Transcript_11241/m.26684 type:complete len:85 (+) Transcript_11241:2736-2990(+)